MTHIIDRQTVGVLEALRMTSDGVSGCSSADALFALKGGVVEQLDLAADFIALQRRILDERPNMPSPKLMLFCEGTPNPEGRPDGTTWIDLKGNRFMVAKGGKWFDPAEGIQPVPSMPPAKRRDWIEWGFDRLSYVVLGALLALAIFN